MRGVAYALFLAKKHGAQKIYYSQSARKNSSFPFLMTDLITIDGLEFVPFEPPVELDTATYIHFSEAGNPLKRYGFSEMSRIKPAQPAVARRLEEICREGPFFTLHARATDAIERNYETKNPDETALNSIRDLSRRMKINRVYVAADNANSYRSWANRLAAEDFHVIKNDARYDPTITRQTGAEDMMVDFFSLARSTAIVRTVPSEFSRFAAWIGNKRLGYTELA